jgi:predicted Zn-ribbon and HTH transcriptional regulator
MESTIRQRIRFEISVEDLTLRELSERLRVSEKELLGHMEHVRRSIKGEEQFVVVASECMKCGFIFTKRTRLKRPSKCPTCRSEEITEPIYSITVR